MNENNFKRIEKKFWLSQQQYRELSAFLSPRIEEDKYGSYTVYNLYLDDDNYSLIRRSIERPYFKEKLRLRSYNLPSPGSKVFLELKRKLDGIGYKRREILDYQRAFDLIDLKVSPATQIEKELLEFIKRYQVKPKVALSYWRQTYRLKEDPDFRLTFDSKLAYELWKPDLDFNQINKPIMANPEAVLLEIKTARAMPLWLSNKLNELEIYQAPFSKIGTVYTKHIRSN